MKTKRNAAAVAGILLVMALSAGGTFAYFSYARSLQNRISVGTNTITIHEDYTPPKKMEAGENIYKKDVKIKNTGTIPCFVRVYAAFSDSSVMEKSAFSADGINFVSAASYADHLPDGWVYISDAEDADLGGYYYYTEPLPAGKGTPSLFKKVKTTFTDANAVLDYEIIIYAESVQILDKEGQEFSGSSLFEDAWKEFLEQK